jgi:uncharacterized membrane protein
MDSIALLIVLAVGFIIIAPIIALLRTGRLKRTAATQEQLGQLTSRIYALERHVAQLQQAIRELTGTKRPEEAASRGPARDTEPPAASAAPTTPRVTLPTPPPAPSTALPVPPREIRDAMAGGRSTEQLAASSMQARSMPAEAGAKTTATAASSEAHRLADLEVRLGTSWLNKIGTAVLVIGVALFLNYTLRHIGPTGKIATGYVLGAALIALGVIGERRERYRIAARAVLGGGWAIFYFTTYAMHNVAAVRVIESATLGFALLFAVAVVMVLHTLRYNSQVATGFAYLLAFASIAVSRIGVGALVASVALAASLAYLLWRHEWYALEPAAVAATYAVHWMWLRQVFEELGGRRPFPQITTSIALLTLYWLVWIVSYFLREERDLRERALLTAAFFLNIAGYLAVMRYQAFYPWLRFWFLLGVGAVYLALSPVAKRLGRRTAFVLTSTMGGTLLATAVPYRYSGARLELLWLAEAEAFLAAGWRLREAHLRRLGWATAAALTIYVWAFPITVRLTQWRPPDARLGWELASIAVAFFLNARLAPRLLGEEIVQLDEGAADVSYGAATALVLAAAWVAIPLMWVALVWSGVAVGLGEWGRRTKSAQLRACAHGAALLAVIRLVAINLFRAEEFHSVNLRLVTVAIAAALFFVEARRLHAFRPALERPGTLRGFADRFGRWPAAYSSSAALLAALILWKEATNAAVGLAWGMLGLALVEAGQSLDDRPLRTQGQILLTLSLVRIFIADLNGTAMIGPVSARVVTVTLLAAIYYYVAFSTPPESPVNVERREPKLRALFLWCAAIALAALLRFELQTSWVAAGWAALVVILYRLGSVLPSAAMRHQAYLLTLLVGVRCAFDNFYQVGAWRFTTVRVATVVTASALLYLLLGRVLWDRSRRAATGKREAQHG